MRWQGGATEDLIVSLPRPVAERWRYPESVVGRVQQLAADQTDEQIAEVFNREDLRSAKGRPFTAKMIQWVRHKHRIPAPILQRPEERTVQQLSEQFHVSRNVVYDWLDKGLVQGRKFKSTSPIWISLTSQQEQALAAYVASSKRIPKVDAQQS